MSFARYIDPTLWVIGMMLAVAACYGALWTGIGCRWIWDRRFLVFTRRAIYQSPAPAAISGSKPFAISEIEARNARCRAQWTGKFYSRAQCADAWPEIARRYSDLRLEHCRRLARAWIRAGEQYRAAQAIAAASNVISLPLHLQRKAK